MDKNILKQAKKSRRRVKVRKKVIGTSERPRLCVFRSNKGMYLQIIDDSNGVTIVSARLKEVKVKKDAKKGDVCFKLGKLIAKKAEAKKIKQIVFDRAGYKYHGRVKSVADGAREGGLEF